MTTKEEILKEFKNSFCPFERSPVDYKFYPNFDAIMGVTAKMAWGWINKKLDEFAQAKCKEQVENLSLAIYNEIKENYPELEDEEFRTKYYFIRGIIGSAMQRPEFNSSLVTDKKE